MYAFQGSSHRLRIVPISSNRSHNVPSPLKLYLYSTFFHLFVCLLFFDFVSKPSSHKSILHIAHARSSHTPEGSSTQRLPCERRNHSLHPTCYQLIQRHTPIHDDINHLKSRSMHIGRFYLECSYIVHSPPISSVFPHFPPLEPLQVSSVSNIQSEVLDYYHNQRQYSDVSLHGVRYTYVSSVFRAKKEMHIIHIDFHALTLDSSPRDFHENTTNSSMLNIK
jgi:hypothetical protein